jgi:uncharacterized protein YacL (UPF0231 family)
MDYQFARDLLNNPYAKCELEYEGFGDWLTHDLMAQRQAIKTLLNTVSKLLQRELLSHQYNGTLYHLIFEDDEVSLFINHHQVSHPEFSDDGEDNYPIAGCGLVDFKQLIDAWSDFVS